MKPKFACRFYDNDSVAYVKYTYTLRAGCTDSYEEHREIFFTQLGSNRTFQKYSEVIITKGDYKKAKANEIIIL
jgi:hypothetical protein